MAAFGFGGRGASRRWRPVGTVGPAMAPGYLAGVAPAPYAAYGVQRVIAAHAGPLFQLRRASDGAVRDLIAPGGGDYPDYAALVAWAGGSALTVATLYDQTGAGRHLTQATVANQPSFDPAQIVGGVAPVLFDGYGRGGGALFPTVQKSMVATGWSVDQAAHTVLWSCDPQNSYNGAGYLQWTDAGGSTRYYNLASGSGTWAGLAGPAARPHVMGYGASASQFRFYEGASTTEQATTKASLAMPRFVFGSSSATPGVMALYGLVVYPAYLSAADAAAVGTSLSTAFAQGATPAYRVVLGGDSIQEGAGARLLLNTTHLLRQQLSRTAETYTPAVSGQTAAQVYAARAAQYGAFHTAARPSIAFVQAGINDVMAGTTGPAIYGDATTGSTFRTIAYLKGLGYKVVVCTLLPWAGSANYTAAREAERQAYNAAVRGNAAGADHVLDLAAHPVMGDAAASTGDTSLFVDALHPTTLGYRWLAGGASGAYAGQFTYYHALQQVLRTAVGDTGYTP